MEGILIIYLNFYRQIQFGTHKSDSGTLIENGLIELNTDKHTKSYTRSFAHLHPSSARVLSPASSPI